MHSVCMSTSPKVQYVQRRSLELLFQSYDLLRFGGFPGIMYNLKSSKHWRQNGRCCQSVTELTLLQEQPKTAMEEAGVPWLDSCTCFDHCPGSLKDHARSGNYHPLEAFWRHVGDVWRVVSNAIELIERSKRSFWNRSIPKLHWRRLQLFSGGLSLFMPHHCIVTFSGDNVWVLLFLKGSVMRYHALTLEEQPTAAMEEAGVAVLEPLTWFMLKMLFQIAKQQHSLETMCVLMFFFVF